MAVVPSARRLAVAVALAGLLLAACGRSASTPSAADSLSVTGTPSLNISVPLTTVGCTTTDYCLAVGTTTLDSGSTSAAQVSGPTGGWHSITISPIPAGSVSRVACGAHTCLISGRDATGTFLLTWSVGDASTTAVSLPDKFLGIADLTCSPTNTADICTAVSDSEPPAFAVSQNFGRTWTPLILLSQWLTATQATIVDVRCSTTSCAAVGTTATGLSAVYVNPAPSTSTTSSVSTTSTTMPSSSATVSSTLSLARKTLVATWCVNLAPTHCTVVVRAADSATSATSFSGVGRHHVVVPAGHTIACAALTGCVSITTSGGLAVTNWHHALSVTQTYVLDKWVSVACGTTRCAAVSATTVTRFRP